MAAGNVSHLTGTDRDNTFRILVATDVHLGYKHLDPVQANDSINTFQEVLQLAQDHQVDFVLLGGDLFHHNKPPREVLHSCFQLLKRYCMGDRKPAFEIVDADDADAEESPTICNVSMPVFSIHGNHDEPTGPHNLSVMDLLHSSGLVHYFGKTDSVEEIHPEPVLLKKGSSRMALYGVGSIRSDKLQKMYRNKRVRMERPNQDPEDWFNVFLLHQNHVPRPDNTHVEEASIHGFLNLVIWGHEHESKLQPMKVRAGDGGEYFVSQPGSTIATAFKKSEMVQKHVGLLTVRGKEFLMQPLALQTVRQMYIQEYEPRVDPADGTQGDLKVTEDCHRKVERLWKKAERTRGPRQPREPLIRIKVQQQHDLMACSTFRFGLRYKGRVANPDSILAFGRQVTSGDRGLSGLTYSTSAHSAIFTVQDLLRQQLRQQTMSFQVLQEEDLLQVVKDSVDSDEKHVVKKIVGKRLEHIQNHLKMTVPSIRLRAVTGGDTLTGQLTDDTESVDSDKELCDVIDMICRQYSAGDDRANVTSETSIPAQGVSNVGSRVDSEDPHGGDDSSSSQPQEEPWLHEMEDEFFRAPSGPSHSRSISTSSSRRTSKEGIISQDAPALRRASTFPRSSGLSVEGPPRPTPPGHSMFTEKSPSRASTLPGSSGLSNKSPPRASTLPGSSGLTYGSPSTSGLPKLAIRKSASSASVAMSVSTDVPVSEHSRRQGFEPSSQLPAAQPHAPSPCKRPRMHEAKE